MISYLRTTKEGASILSDALEDISFMVIDSVRNETKTQVFSKGEAIAYELDLIDRINFYKVRKSSKVFAIKTEDLQTAQIKELLYDIRDAKWTTIKSKRKNGREYAYKTRSGEIRFKLDKMRKERVFECEC